LPYSAKAISIPVLMKREAPEVIDADWKAPIQISRARPD
jgi:hypothetical protein